ncbi:ATP-binding protein [Kitasatospora sp. NPDC048365]|uniref:ATP-binding protein n=1 Tax=Kitasatospora sp. NPDC048365 TaxID=3364050 RepID=UPI00371239E2
MGRKDELRRLLAALGDGPAVIFVSGEAGIGKSRLLQEATDRLADEAVPVLRGWCHPLREPLPFGPAIEALRAGRSHFRPGVSFGPATAALAAHLPELADRLPEPGPEAVEGNANQGLMRAVHEMLAALGPAVLMVEDVHWADDATRDLLLLLARNPPPHLRLVLTYREHDLPGPGNVLGPPYRRPVGVGGTDIALDLLTEAQVRELAVSVVGPAATGHLCRELFERSGGLPLAAEEDLLVVADRVARTHGTDAAPVLDEVRVPRAVQEAVDNRLAGLDPDATAIVQAAAVLAVPVGEELLAAVAALSDDQAEDAVIAAIRADVLTERGPGRYGFRHVLALRAVYDTVPGPRRRRLHGRAVDALSAQGMPALVQIAHHTRRLGDTAAWLPRAQAAADHAAAVGDDGIASDLLGQLLAEPALPPGDRTRAALALSTIAVDRTDPAASIAILRGIVADPALATETRGEIRFNLGRALANTDAYRDSRAELEQAIAELESRPGSAAAVTACLGFYSAMSPRGGPAAENLALMERATRLAETSGDPVARADVLANRISLLELLGHPQGRELLEQLPRESTDRRVLRHCARAVHNAAYSGLARGCDDAVRGLLGEAEDLCDRVGSQFMRLGCRLIRLHLDLAAGRWNGLDRTIEAMLLESAEDSPHRLELLLARGTLDTARGQWNAAREDLLPLVDGLDEDIGPPAVAVLARLDLLEGDAPAAWRRTEQALASRRRKGLWARPVDLVPTAVEAALACGLHDDARRLTDEAERGIAGLDAPAATAGVSWCRGMLAADADPDEAVVHLERARARYRAIGRVHTTARVTERIGRLDLAHRPDWPEAAVSALQDALDIFDRLGATADAARCEQALRVSGHQRTGPRGHRVPAGSLSPREQQVAEFLATGATNKDIARTLALSPRTVEHHVAGVLRKLGTTRDHVRDTLDTTG